MRIPQRKAVAPVIATLLMIAVAVAMSVIIFMWSQGFLSNTSSATGGQQGAQNVAAQSSLSIEVATSTSTTSGTACTTGISGTCVMNLIIRNVGSVSIDLGSIQVYGLSSNAGFKGNLIAPSLASTTALSASSITSSSQTWKLNSNVATQGIVKGSSVVLTLYVSTAGTATSDTVILPGDTLNFKVTTAVGTFAASQFTVP